MFYILEDSGHTDSLYIKYVVQGLNIFRVNQFKSSLRRLTDVAREELRLSSDPLWQFLQILSAKMPCTAHIGYLGLEDIDDPTKYLEKMHDLRKTSIHYYGEYYTDPIASASCMSSSIEKPFWNDVTLYLWQVSAVSFYFGDVSNELLNSIEQYVLKCIIDSNSTSQTIVSKQWRNRVLGQAMMIVEPGHDGYEVNIYQRKDGDPRIWRLALDSVERYITGTTFFRESQSHLRWSEDYKCFVAE